MPVQSSFAHETEETAALTSHVAPSKHLLHKERLRALHPLHAALAFLALSITLGALFVLLTLYTPCYRLVLNGVPVGVVQSRSFVAQTAEQVEAQLSHILGKAYTLQTEPTYQLTIAAKADLLSYGRISEALYAAVPDIKQAYVLTVDGKNLGATEDKTALDAVLAQMQQPFVGEQTKDVFFANETRITRKYIPREEEFSKEGSLLADLRRSVTAETVYEVRRGDTIASVSAAHGMTTAQLLAANPKLSIKTGLLEGQMIRVQKNLPLLSVCTVNQYTQQRSVKSPLREVKDETMFEGESRLIQAGQAGLEEVEAKDTLLNGQVQYQEILARKTIQAPTETVMAVGTKARPLYYSTGSLRWPCNGTITSPFGYRTFLGGDFHQALDIASGYGTQISAADSGIVTFAGYKGSYGNLVIVDHGNGWQTYYAHNSALSVSAGDGVVKGQAIAAMGATGRATGSHCHFELRINGEPVNPQGYLP